MICLLLSGCSEVVQNAIVFKLTLYLFNCSGLELISTGFVKEFQDQIYTPMEVLKLIAYI